MLGINMMGIAGMLFNPIIRMFYWIVFGFYRAIASVLDVLTHLFYIFSGMTPISSTDGTTINGDGQDTGVDIVNYFVQREDFIDAYIGLCLVALGLIVVFTIAKIIKQDYFDRAGPRSKAPIFRNVALSFIAFICVIPVFMFIIQAAGLLATIVMKQFGLDTSQGVGTMLFYLSWDDGGSYFMTEYASSIGTDADLLHSYSHFGKYGIKSGGDILYHTFWNAGAFESIEKPAAEFYWYMFIITGFILIVNLGKMMIAMVTRLYKMIALFIIAPSPISQIVIDDGQKFKKWKDDLIKETLKVVGCVMCFMVFILIAKFVPALDLTKFVTEGGPSSIYKNLIEDNNLTAGISSLYYESTSGGIDPDTGKLNLDGMDAIVNALGKCVILIAGVGAIQDMDSVITPLLSGGSSSMELGNAGNAVIKGGMAAAKGAWDLGKLAASKAVGLVGGAAKGIGGLGKEGWNIITDKPTGGAAPSIASNVGQGGSGGNGAVSPTAGSSSVGGDEQAPSAPGQEAAATPTVAQEGQEAAGVNANSGAPVPEEQAQAGDGQTPETQEAAAAPESMETPEDVSEEAATQQSAGIPTSETDGNGSAASGQSTGTGNATPFSKTAGGKAARLAAFTGRALFVGGAKGAAKLTWGGVKTAAKAGSIMLKTLLSMTGMGAVAKGLDQAEKDVVGGVTKVGSKMFGKKRDKDGKPIVKRDENGNVVKDKYGKPVYEYNSAFGAGVAGITSHVGGALGQYLTDEGVAANLDRIDARDRARAERSQTVENINSNQQQLESVVGETNNVARILNGNVQDDKLGDVSVYNSAEGIVTTGEEMLAAAQQVNQESGGTNEQLVDDSAQKAAVQAEVTASAQQLQAAETHQNAVIETISAQKGQGQDLTKNKIQTDLNGSRQKINIKKMKPKEADQTIQKVVQSRKQNTTLVKSMIREERSQLDQKLKDNKITQAEYNEQVQKLNMAYLYATDSSNHSYGNEYNEFVEKNESKFGASITGPKKNRDIKYEYNLQGTAEDLYNEDMAYLAGIESMAGAQTVAAVKRHDAAVQRQGQMKPQTVVERHKADLARLTQANQRYNNLINQFGGGELTYQQRLDLDNARAEVKVAAAAATQSMGAVRSQVVNTSRQTTEQAVQRVKQPPKKETHTVKLKGNKKPATTRRQTQNVAATQQAVSPFSRRDVILDLRIDNSELISQLRDEGYISDSLYEACNISHNGNALEGMLANEQLFEGDYFDDQQLETALNNMFAELSEANMEERGVSSFSAYHNQLKSEYTAARNNYVQQMEMVKTHLQRGRSGGQIDPAALEQAREAMAAAVNSSITLNNIKKEIKENSR